MEQLWQYTNNPSQTQLHDLLMMLHGDRDVLIVLNHPMWDLVGIGNDRHVNMLHDFVTKLGVFIHAYELGGLRSWKENQAVVEFAEAWGEPLIGGGDRHGREPSAVVNLTNAQNFTDFVHEVREKRQCHVLFMPQYNEPISLRILDSLLDVIHEYPDYPKGSRRWDERVFHPDGQGVLRPVAALWDEPPTFIRAFFAVVRLLEVPPIRNAMRVALEQRKHQTRFVPLLRREVASQWKNSYGSRISRTLTTKSTGSRTLAGNLRRSPKGADFPF
jgi:hypothetical protein